MLIHDSYIKVEYVSSMYNKMLIYEIIPIKTYRRKIILLKRYFLIKIIKGKRI